MLALRLACPCALFKHKTIDMSTGKLYIVSPGAGISPPQNNRIIFMAMPITQERAERRALILGYLANHGPCPTRPIYEAIKELSDSSEAARLIYDMKAAGEIVSDAVELSEVQRLHWRIPPSAGRLVQVHRLAPSSGPSCWMANIGEPAPALAAEEPPATPPPAPHP